MCPVEHDGKLHIAGDDGGQGSALGAHGGQTKVTEDEHIVEAQIHQHRHHACGHGHLCLSRLPEGAGVGVGQRKGEQTPEHHMQVLQAVIKGLGPLCGVAVALQIQAHQLGVRKVEQGDAADADDETGDHFVAEGPADTLMVAGAVELGGKDARTCHSAKDAKVEDEHQLVDDGHAAHQYRAGLTDHDVIQQGNKVGDGILNDDGYRYAGYAAVEGPVTNISF